MIYCNVTSLDEKIHAFAKFGDTGKGGITRFSLSPEALAARAEFQKRMEAIGAIVTTDDMANMPITYISAFPSFSGSQKSTPY